MADMMALYPGTSAVRIFVGAGKPLPAWDGAVLGGLGDALPHVSFKTWDLAALRAWLDAMPDRPLILTYAHEPEQGTAAGDPTPEVFQARWAELVVALADHPKRALIWLVPVYTRYWWQAHPDDLRYLVEGPGIDAIGWDVYNNGTGYRSPDDLLAVPRAIAARTGLPYLLAELGAVRLATDTAGSGRQAWMRAMVDAAAGDRAWTACWFHKDEWDLTGQPEQQTWQTIITEEAPVATTAPDNLKAVRALLLDHLPIEAAALGIVGDPAHRGGYHCGADRVVSGDYSVVESSRDRTGLAEWACALDVGSFSVTAAGKRHDLRTFSVWLAGQCAADAPDTRNIREVIYSPDGTTVKRWDRLGKRSSGDDSHRWHTHISYHRDAIKAGRDQTPLFTRYLTEIGLLEDPVTPEDIKAIAKATADEVLGRKFADYVPNADGTRPALSVSGALFAARQDAYHGRAAAVGAQAGVSELAGKDFTDEQAIVAGVLAGVDPATLAERIAAALPADQAKQLADELATRLQG